MSVDFHFLNVGDGDCTIIDFPARINQSTGKEKDARVMMVDIHHNEDNPDYSHVFDYYNYNFPRRSIFRFVASHPHADHLRGLKGLFEESGISVLNFWDLEHSFEPQKTGERWQRFQQDWQKYCEVRQSGDENLFVRRYWDDTKSCQYWDEDRIQILSPSKELYDHVHYCDDGKRRQPQEIGHLLNNMPYVILISVNDVKIMLASDAEERCWRYILDHHKDKIKKVNVLKAAHHGRLSGYHEEAVKHMNPDLVVFSMSKNCRKEHGAHKDYQRALPNTRIKCTSEHGNLVVRVGFNGKVENRPRLTALFV